MNDSMLDVLENIVRTCGDVTLSLRAQGLQTEDKDEAMGAHFATQADEQSQEVGISMLLSAYPAEIIVAEEQKNDSAIPPNCTVFDPIDGTTAYYNGCREFGITLCTLRSSQPRHGVIYFPADDVMISAERGKGWFINGERQLMLEWDRPMDKTMIGTDIGPWYVREVADGVAQDGFTMRSLMAGVYGARAVLTKETGAYYNLNIAKIWDAAAGTLILEEAGGVAYDPWGNPLKWDSINMDWVWAANEYWAQRVLTHTKPWPGRKGAKS